MSLIVAGAPVATPGLEVISWLDDPHVQRVTDGKARTVRPISVVLHTVHGKRGPLRPGSKASARAEMYARYQARTPREVSWHLTVDTDSTILQSADVALWHCWHAPPTNAWSVGIELVQDDDGSLYADQIASTVRLLDLLCAQLTIPRRVPVSAPGVPRTDTVRTWCAPKEGGRSDRWAGVLGHRNVTKSRGPGDPGDHVFLALLAAGYEGVAL